MTIANPTPPAKPHLGVCTSLLGHRAPLTTRKIRDLAATGVDYLELSALQALHMDVFDTERMEELLAALDACESRVWSIHAPFCQFAMDDPDARADGIRLLGKTMDTASRFGARYVVVHPGRDIPSIDRRRELAWTRDAMAAAADMAPAGVAVALETMGIASLAGPADEMLEVLDGLDPAKAGVCLDAGHVHQGADVAAYVRAIAGRILTVHLHDNHGRRDEHNLPGRGTIDWPALLRSLHETGYRGVLMCEGGQADLTVAEAVADYTHTMTTFWSEAFSG